MFSVGIKFENAVACVEIIGVEISLISLIIFFQELS